MGQKTLLDKDFAGAAANMSILWKINFCDARLVAEQQANIFHNVEADINNLSRAQPFQNFTALKGNRQIAQVRDRKSPLCRRGSSPQVDIGGIEELILDPVFFFGRNHRRAPNTMANIPAECFFQIRNDPAANPVAQRRQIFVRRVLGNFSRCLPT